MTLERCDDDEVCWGAAYRIAPEDVDRVVEILEIREKQYDLRVQLDLYEEEYGGKSGGKISIGDGDEAANDDNAGKVTGCRGAPVIRDALTYIATSDPANLNWLGPASVEDVAAQIAAAEGPSGPNREYLFNLAEVRATHKTKKKTVWTFLHVL